MMTLEDYNSLPNFSAHEVVKTGGDPLQMQRQAMYMLQDFRTLIDRRFRFQYGGLNSGNHASKEHPAGCAIDGYLDPRDGDVDQRAIQKVFKAALQVGFKGIGIYYNGTLWSFHLDTRAEYGLWTGRKKAPGAGGWVYRNMLIGAPA